MRADTLEEFNTILPINGVPHLSFETSMIVGKGRWVVAVGLGTGYGGSICVIDTNDFSHKIKKSVPDFTHIAFIELNEDRILLGIWHKGVREA